MTTLAEFSCQIILQKSFTVSCIGPGAGEKTKRTSQKSAWNAKNAFQPLSCSHRILLSLRASLCHSWLQTPTAWSSLGGQTPLTAGIEGSRRWLCVSDGTRMYPVWRLCCNSPDAAHHFTVQYWLIMKEEGNMKKLALFWSFSQKKRQVPIANQPVLTRGLSV